MTPPLLNINLDKQFASWFFIAPALGILLFVLGMCWTYLKRMAAFEFEVASVTDDATLPRFPKVYRLIMNGAFSRKDEYLTVFTGNLDEALFTRDLKTKYINHVIIMGHPYEISFHMDNDEVVYYKLKHVCTTLSLKTCSNMDIFYVPDNKVIHMLGYNVV